MADLAEEIQAHLQSGDFDIECKLLRRSIKEAGAQTKSLIGHPVFASPPENREYAEMKANVMLAYRHLEDAVMRLGKAIQAYDGGKSVYEG